MIDKVTLNNLYASGKSMRDIANTLRCSENKIAYWMKKYKLERRSRSEATYLKANPSGDPFHIKQKLNKNDYFLLGLSLGIYWGEGTKAGKHSLRVSNTDPALLRVFKKFLLEFCAFDPKRITYSIVCFNDTNPEIARGYWANELKTNPEKFGKITQIPTQGKGTYKKKSQFGVCTICATNFKLKAWLLDQINQIKIMPD